jgi:catechol 2,3-dioxygenase-like lactoylglutathione lyase family enzyme
MIDHTGFNVSDAARSKIFYDAVFAAIGGRMLLEVPHEYTGGRAVRGYGTAGRPQFWTAEGPPNEPRIHIAFTVKSEAEVEAFYRAGLANGGKDNGAPGPRTVYGPNYYAAFVLDPDGYNVEAVYRGG